MSVKYLVLLGGCGLLIWSAIQEGIRVAGSLGPVTTPFATTLKKEVKALEAVKASVDDLVKPDGIRPEVLRAGLIPGSECPAEDPARPEAETRLARALRPRSDALAATRKFSTEFARVGGPDQARLADFTGTYRQLLVERRGVAADEAQALALIPRVVERGEGRAELDALFERLKMSKMTNQSTLDEIKRAKVPWPPSPEVAARGNTLLLVPVTTDLMAVPNLAGLIGQIQPDQLIGGSAWSVDTRQVRKWSGVPATSPGQGTFGEEDFNQVFTATFRAIRELQAVRGTAPLQVIIVWSSSNNPDELPPGERALEATPERTRIVWLTPVEQSSTRLIALFPPRSMRVDSIPWNEPEKLAGLPATINAYINRPLP